MRLRSAKKQVATTDHERKHRGIKKIPSRQVQPPAFSTGDGYNGEHSRDGLGLGFRDEGCKRGGEDKKSRSAPVPWDENHPQCHHTGDM